MGASRALHLVGYMISKSHSLLATNVPTWTRSFLTREGRQATDRLLVRSLGPNCWCYIRVPPGRGTPVPNSVKVISFSFFLLSFYFLSFLFFCLYSYFLLSLKACLDCARTTIGVYFNWIKDILGMGRNVVPPGVVGSTLALPMVLLMIPMGTK